MADQPLVFTGYNIFGVKSPFTELWAGYPSMSECTVDGASTLHALDGSCVIVEKRHCHSPRQHILDRNCKKQGAFPLCYLHSWTWLLDTNFHLLRAF
ncbi:MAG: hypothetical protein RMK94_09455 [Armatimonadota bacterium]|nr:hypothetical protein [Armatimonadota bacterium]